MNAFIRAARVPFAIADSVIAFVIASLLEAAREVVCFKVFK